MSLFNKHSWKSKIDPEFDAAVKTLLRFFREIKRASDDGFFAINNNFQEIILNSTGWQTGYDGKELIRLVNEAYEGYLDSDSLVKRFESYRSNKKRQHRLKKFLFTLAAKLPEASKKYYELKIESLSDGSFHKQLAKLYGKNKEKAIKQVTCDALTFYCSLMCRLILQDLERNTDLDNNQIKLLDRPSALNTFMNIDHSIFSQIAFQKSIYELLQEENDSSLLKAIRVDKTLLCTDVVKQRLMKAQLSGDVVFFQKLARAIEKKPIAKEAPQYETYIVLWFFWLMGLNTLKLNQLYQFLKDCGLNPPEYPSGLDKFLQRHIYPLYGK